MHRKCEDLFIYLYLSFHWSLSLCICLSIYLYLSCLSIGPSVHLSIHLPVSNYSFICVSFTVIHTVYNTLRIIFIFHQTAEWRVNYSSHPCLIQRLLDSSSTATFCG